MLISDALPKPSSLGASFVRGDANDDGRIDLGDAEARRKRDSFTIPLLARHGEHVVASFVLMAMIVILIEFQRNRHSRTNTAKRLTSLYEVD